MTERSKDIRANIRPHPCKDDALLCKFVWTTQEGILIRVVLAFTRKSVVSFVERIKIGQEARCQDSLGHTKLIYRDSMLILRYGQSKVVLPAALARVAVEQLVKSNCT